MVNPLEGNTSALDIDNRMTCTNCGGQAQKIGYAQITPFMAEVAYGCFKCRHLMELTQGRA